MREIDRIGLKPAAAAGGLSERTARKWQHRWASEGALGLLDRSSRPARCPRRSDATKVERAVALRRNQRLTYERIAERVGLSRSAVARSCKAAGVARLPGLQDAVPVRRYERQSAGELLHLDTKKLGRFDTVIAGDDRPVVHSDRGGHYRWPGWLTRIADARLVRSMSRKACSPDNAACEGFFGRLKNELFYARDWLDTTINEFMVALDAYIRWYNEARIKLSLGSRSPIEHRKSLGIAV